MNSMTKAATLLRPHGALVIPGIPPAARVRGCWPMTTFSKHIATLKKILARARALDRELLLERLEALYHATMAEGRLNAAIQALRLMAQIGGHTSRAAQEDYAESELDDGRPFGPLQRAARQVSPRPATGWPATGSTQVDADEIEAEALLRDARLSLARTRPDSQPGKIPLRARLFMGTAGVRVMARGSTGQGPGDSAGGPSFDTPGRRRSG